MKFEVKNGSFGYDKTSILNNISFSVEDGQVLAVLGANGRGKTTLLKCMMGLLPWKNGQTLIDGKPMSSMKHAEVWKKIAYVPQSKGTALSYTAIEMVVMGCSARLGIFEQPSKEHIAEAEAAMKAVGVFWLRDKKCSEMSGGELQMVLIARALSARPKLLVLDEPESNLDFKNQLIILDTIKRLAKEQSIAAIVNTHYPAHALKIADQSLILNKDGSYAYGPAEETITEENMEKAFSVEVKICDYHYGDHCYKNVIPIRAC